MNAIEKIEEVTGLKRGDMKRIFEEVKANQSLLNSCSLHDFQPHVKYDSGMVRKYKCTHCGGTADHMAVSWYNKGLSHRT